VHGPRLVDVLGVTLLIVALPAIRRDLSLTQGMLGSVALADPNVRFAVGRATAGSRAERQGTSTLDR
jgi:hypothetical protein